MSVTLEDLLDKIWFGAQNTVEKGSSFEHLIASYLRTAPELSLIHISEPTRPY